MTVRRRLMALEKAVQPRDQKECTVIFEENGKSSTLPPSRSPPCGWKHDRTLDGCLRCRMVRDQDKYVTSWRREEFRSEANKNDGLDWMLPNCFLMALKDKDGVLAHYFCSQRLIPWSKDHPHEESEICARLVLRGPSKGAEAGEGLGPRLQLLDIQD